MVDVVVDVVEVVDVVVVLVVVVEVVVVDVVMVVVVDVVVVVVVTSEWLVMHPQTNSVINRALINLLSFILPHLVLHRSSNRYIVKL